MKLLHPLLALLLLLCSIAPVHAQSTGDPGPLGFECPGPDCPAASPPPADSAPPRTGSADSEHVTLIRVLAADGEVHEYSYRGRVIDDSETVDQPLDAAAAASPEQDEEPADAGAIDRSGTDARDESEEAAPGADRPENEDPPREQRDREARAG